jgi:hypothetical protein
MTNKDPLTVEHIAELRQKLAKIRGFLMQLQSTLEDLHLPVFATFNTVGGEIDLTGGTLEEIKRLLKETNDV